MQKHTARKLTCITIIKHLINNSGVFSEAGIMTGSINLIEPQDPAGTGDY